MNGKGLRNLLATVVNRLRQLRGNSKSISDRAVIDRFVENPKNTFLVSFPRTGSHWLRMLMELYFGRPSLVRVFFHFNERNYLTLHTHDLDLDVVRSHVIYLYRDPVDTVFSQLKYHREPHDDRERIAFWSELFGKHLHKWLVSESFTTNKTVVSYEGLKSDLAAEFGKIALHFGEELNGGRLEQASAIATKDRVKQKTRHDAQVVQLSGSYRLDRSEFREKYGTFVWDVLTDDRSKLVDFFEKTP